MLLCHQKRVEYHLKNFKQYYKLIPVASEGRRAGDKRKDIRYFTFRAWYGSHDALIIELLDNVKRWMLAWVFVVDSGNYPHNWRVKVPEDQYDHFLLNEEQLMQFNNHFRDGILSRGWSYRELVTQRPIRWPVAYLLTLVIVSIHLGYVHWLRSFMLVDFSLLLTSDMLYRKGSPTMCRMSTPWWREWK